MEPKSNMNTRLYELDDAAQSYAGQVAGTDESSNHTEWFNVYKEEFARLIVEECVAQCMSDDYKNILAHFDMPIEEDEELIDGTACPCGHDGGTSCGSQYCFLTNPFNKD